MIKALIIDDEPLAIGNLSELVRKYCPEVQITGFAVDAENAFEQIAVLKPELVFLDIEMPGENAFDLLSRLGRRDFELIFVTAFDQFALKAIKHDATDYILKPIAKAELIVAVDKAIKHIQLKSMANPVQPRSGDTQATGNSAKLGIPSMEGLLFVEQQDIMYCEAEGKYTRFFMKDTQILMSSKNIGEYEAVLSNDEFVRIHHHYLVNLKFVAKYVKGRGGFVVMNNGAVLDVSIRRKDDFLHRFIL